MTLYLKITYDSEMEITSSGVGLELFSSLKFGFLLEVHSSNSPLFWDRSQGSGESSSSHSRSAF